MLYNTMDELYVQRKHGKTELFIERTELTPVNETGSNSKLVLLTQFNIRCHATADLVLDRSGGLFAMAQPGQSK